MKRLFFGQTPSTPASSTPTTSTPASSSSGGWFSSLTNLFSSSSTPAASTAASSAAAPSFTPPDPSTLMSKYFTLAQLTVTSLPNPNLPVDQVSLNNLKQLGQLLDAIQDNVGTFIIASAYRSPANQLAIQQGAAGTAAATMAVPKSYHSQGLAADITPNNGQTPHEFAVAMYNAGLVNVLTGQLCDKSDGGNETSLHISVTTPKFPTCTPMYVGSDGQYYRVPQDELASWLASSGDPLDSSVSASTDQDSDTDVGDVTDTSSGLWLAVGTLAFVGAGYFFFRKKQSSGA
jgi:LAS superfamily LD-carboxypeptidase LdcB